MIRDFQQTTVANIGLLAQASRPTVCCGDLANCVAVPPRPSHRHVPRPEPQQPGLLQICSCATTDKHTAHHHCCGCWPTDADLPLRTPAPSRKQLSRTSAERGQMLSSALRVKLVYVVYRDMVQLMPLLSQNSISCLILIQTVFTFLAPAYPGCPGKDAIKRV